MTGYVYMAERRWKAAGWVVRYLAREVHPLLGTRSELGRDLVGMVELGSLDLRLDSYDESEVADFTAAAAKVATSTRSSRPEQVLPEYYEGLCDRLADLNSMLQRPHP